MAFERSVKPLDIYQYMLRNLSSLNDEYGLCWFRNCVSFIGIINGRLQMRITEVCL